MATSMEEASRVMLRGNNSGRQVSDMLWRRGLQPSMIALVVEGGGGCLWHGTSPVCKPCIIIMPRPFAQTASCFVPAGLVSSVARTQAGRLAAAYCGQD